MREVKSVIRFDYDSSNNTSMQVIVKAFKAVSKIFDIFENTSGVSLKDPTFSNVIENGVSTVIIEAFVIQDEDNADIGSDVCEIAARETGAIAYTYNIL